MAARDLLLFTFLYFHPPALILNLDLFSFISISLGFLLDLGFRSLSITFYLKNTKGSCLLKTCFGNNISPRYAHSFGNRDIS